jgi:hypothetical protein
LGNTFLYVCVEEACYLWAQPCSDTFHLLPIITEALWATSVLQVGKQVVVARSEIRSLRRLVKQLQVEILHQCLSASGSMQTYIVIEEHYTGCQHFTPFFLNGPMPFFFLVFCNTLVMLLWSHVVWIPPSAYFSVPENSCHQLSGRQRLFKLFQFVCWMCVHPLLWQLISAFTNETQVSSFVTHIMWLRNLLPFLWYCYKKVVAEAIFCVLCTSWVFLEPILRKICDFFLRAYRSLWNAWRSLLKRMMLLYMLIGSCII